jgi:2-amino-4-hydroxy-6-hydroxymethyldihydropteridine diphosphokinase
VNAVIALGSNLGERLATINGAIASLDRTPGVLVTRVSSIHETEPVGGPPGQGMCLNAAALIATEFEPLELLRVLQDIETLFGRQRTIHWGERTLDLDLLLFEDRILETPELCLPHPRMRERRFVLEPLLELAPAAVDPVTRLPFAVILADLVANSG